MHEHARVTSPGTPYPLGASVTPDGTQFCLASRHASAVTLLLFAAAADTEPAARIRLDPRVHRTGDVWHAVVGGVGPGDLYLYSVDGPGEKKAGHRFDPRLQLFDPYAKAFTAALPPRPSATAPAVMPRCIVVTGAFDWKGDRAPRHRRHERVIYETHVRGFTAHPSAGVAHPGTYLGLIERIPYLQRLGVTTVELLPVQEADEFVAATDDAGAPLRNYWGYNSIGLFAPRAAYAATRPPDQVDEFKRMVRALHAADLEIVLDIVFNHSAEGAGGPTVSYRGIDNASYYLLDQNGDYLDLTGCGNTLNCDHPLVRQLIVNCLRYWVAEMHVDGFRLDLAAVLSRTGAATGTGAGAVTPETSVLAQIAADPLLQNTLLIAEPWDAAGTYLLGELPERWLELNDRFRDDVRRFWRGDAATAASLATRLAGSSDLFAASDRSPSASVNHVTSHDGFTLNDLVSYADKHNEANGEDNTDGANSNFSANYGVEGATDDVRTEAVRRRQMKNLLATLLLSRGTPFLLGGDELGRTQRGNNNAYCQDNEVSWYDWTPGQRSAELQRFCREVIALRRAHHLLRRDRFVPDGDSGEVTWLAADGTLPAWEQMDGHLAMLLDGGGVPNSDLLLLLNASTGGRDFVVPVSPQGGTWRRLVDTALQPPDDVTSLDIATTLAGVARYPVGAQALVVLAAPPPDS